MYTGLAYSGSRRRHRSRELRRIRLGAVLVIEGWLLAFLLIQVLRIREISLSAICKEWIGGQVARAQMQDAEMGLLREKIIFQEKVLFGEGITFRERSLLQEGGVPSIYETLFAAHRIPVIALDAGHGGTDAGCSAEGIEEKQINLQIANLVSEKLTQMGYQVFMIREEDGYFGLADRAKLANFRRADAYISIHQNYYEEDSAVSGMETWFYGADTDRDSRRLAQLIHKETIESTGAAARELRDDANFYVTEKTAMPSCLIETGFLSNPQERELLATPEYQEKIANGIAEGIRLYFQPKTMYLTFDDGPSAENTSRVLDILKEHGIKATFFLVGENVEKNPEVARRIVEEGHSVGIHCYHHDYEELYQSVDSYLEDFEKAYQAVYAATGVEAKLFRFPGGSVNDYNKDVYEDVIEAMTEQGFIYHDWNASLEDAFGKAEPEELIANAKESTLGRQRVVLLGHDIVYNTGMCLEGLLDALPEYRMEPLTEETEPIRFR